MSRLELMGATGNNRLLRSWERFSYTIAPVLIGAAIAWIPSSTLLSWTQSTIVPILLGIIIVALQPAYWLSSYRPPDSNKPFFAKEMTTGDHLLSMVLWALSLVILIGALATVSSLSPLLHQMVHAAVCVTLGILLAKTLFPGHVAGLFARAGDERYAGNQAIAHGIALRIGCMLLILLPVLDQLAPQPLPMVLMAGIVLSSVQLTYHAAMWWMESRGESIEE